MIVISGKIRIKSGKRKEAVAQAQIMAQASQAEPGCHHYAFYAGLDDPDTFFLFEEWEDEAALAHHFQTEHMANFNRHIPNLVAEMNVHRYDVNIKTKM